MLALSVVSVVTAVASLVVLLWFVVRQRGAKDDGAIRRLIADEAVRSRDVARHAATALRQEVTTFVGTLGSVLQSAADHVANVERERFDRFAAEIRRVLADPEARP